MAHLEDDRKEHKAVKSFKDELSKEAERIVKEVFPQQMVALQEAMEGELFTASDLGSVHCDYKVTLGPPPAPLANGPGAEATPPSRKKRRHDDDLVGDHFKQPPLFPAVVPSNPRLVAMIEFLKPEIVALVDRCNVIKTWIQVMVPKIEDGNNFGVSIQEDVLAEVSKCESDAGSYLEQLSRYYSSRGKLVSKVAKYPALEDYHRSVDVYDEKVFVSFKMLLREMRNIYVVLYDVILKNYKKITHPRSSNTTSLY